MSRRGRLAWGYLGILLLTAIAHAQEYSSPPVQPDSLGYTTRTFTYHSRRVEESIAYPVIKRFAPTIRRRLNQMIRKDARAAYLENRSDLLESASNQPDVSDMYIDRDARVWFLDSDLVSIIYSWDAYTGGAHPGGFYSSDVYRVGPDGIHRVALGELFRSGSGYDTVLARLITADVLQNDPDSAWGNGEELRESLLEYDYLNNFALTPDGLLFVAWPGAHVMGPIESLVLWEEVEGILKRPFRSRR
jgi:hypothetical protein